MRRAKPDFGSRLSATAGLDVHGVTGLRKLSSPPPIKSRTGIPSILPPKLTRQAASARRVDGHTGVGGVFIGDGDRCDDTVRRGERRVRVIAGVREICPGRIEGRPPIDLTKCFRPENHSPSAVAELYRGIHWPLHGTGRGVPIT